MCYLNPGQVVLVMQVAGRCIACGAQIYSISFTPPSI